jgi:hypothetical protein
MLKCFSFIKCNSVLFLIVVSLLAVNASFSFLICTPHFLSCLLSSLCSSMCSTCVRLVKRNKTTTKHKNVRCPSYFGVKVVCFCYREMEKES